MVLTTAQKQTVKADIAANPDLNSQPNSDDGLTAIADLYNAVASPTFTVWKTLVAIGDIGQAFDSGEVGGLTTANSNRLLVEAAYLAKGVNPSLATNRGFFDDVFSGSGGVNTRANLLVLWKRPAKRIEKLFATGTGSNASPATLVLEGTITYQQVGECKNS